ncbi:MAG TPA: aminotransferase class I/II-fold pyridoxal phosphate-dependent enzyme [Bryobacteraceae bacterium]|nr:aminotransferase class I/II-fold pyridoxal phosphate-dependent enzyme [Bryobacteraceae bacterium]
MQNKNDHPSVRPDTAVLTRGFDPALSVGSARPAVFRSSTYVFSSPETAERAFDIQGGRARAEPGEHVDLIYSRFNHPNAEILEDQIVPLEKDAQAAAVFNSGMAAIMTAILAFAKPGDHIVYTVPLYGGTQHFIHDFLKPFGITGAAVMAGDGEALVRAIQQESNVRLVLVETPANPTLVMTDIRQAVEASATCRPRPLVMVDNTFLGPAFQHPLELGADIVLYSATKYLGGFSDLLGGFAIAADAPLIKKIKSKRALFGNILQPDECWILDSRLPTVPLRMNRASKNAQRIAEHLAGSPQIRKIYYPSLFEDAGQIRIRQAQCDYPGAIISLDLAGGKAAAFEFLRNLRLARNAVSLGGVETLVCHPKSTTHSSVSAEELRISGVTDGLVRISIGIEHWKDLLADFRAALDAIPAGTDLQPPNEGGI